MMIILTEPLDIAYYCIYYNGKKIHLLECIKYTIKHKHEHKHTHTDKQTNRHRHRYRYRQTHTHTHTDTDTQNLWNLEVLTHQKTDASSCHLFLLTSWMMKYDTK